MQQEKHHHEIGPADEKGRHHGHLRHHGHAGAGSHDSHEHHPERYPERYLGHEQEEPRQSSGVILTVRAVSGLSGDMMLAGLAAVAGLKDTELEALVHELNLPALRGALKLEARSVNHIAGVGCRIDLPQEHAHRSLADIRQMITDSAMQDDAKDLSIRAFTALGEAESAVHGKKTDDVTFHEVGALDSIMDTCLVCRIFTILKPARFICSPLPLADGVIHCAHGRVPSPAPAVLRMLEGVRVCGFSGCGETVTPTALSLLKALGAEFGPWPAMTVSKTAISYGSKVFENAPNGAVWALGKLSSG